MIYPVRAFSQGKSFFIEPLINAQFSVKSSYKILNQDSEKIELLPMTKIGNIDFSAINLGLGFGYRQNRNSFSFFLSTIYTTNGYSCIYYPSENVIQAQYYKLKQDSRRLFLGTTYSYELQKIKNYNHSISINYGLSFNRSSDIPPSQTSFSSFTSIDSTDFKQKQLIGHHITLTYLMSLNTEKGVNIFDLSISGSVGLRNLDVLYIRQTDNIGNQNNFISKSRGSYISIGVSRKIHFKIK